MSHILWAPDYSGHSSPHYWDCRILKKILTLNIQSILNGLMEHSPAPYHKFQWSDNVCDIQSVFLLTQTVYYIAHHNRSWPRISYSHCIKASADQNAIGRCSCSLLRASEYHLCCGQPWVWHMFFGKGLWWVVPTNKERHQNSGEILYLYNVKIEGGGGLSIWSCRDKNSHRKTCLNDQWLNEIASSGLCPK